MRFLLQAPSALPYAQIFYYVVAAVSILFALAGYRRSKKLEAARWSLQLYEKFYEQPRFKAVRAQLDCESGTARAAELVHAESDDFTDYLNFFEFIAYLKKAGQLSSADVEALFSYYLDCLWRHREVRTYINDPQKGFEELRSLLKSRSSLARDSSNN